MCQSTDGSVESELKCKLNFFKTKLYDKILYFVKHCLIQTLLQLVYSVDIAIALNW